jgi:hypothetical protein
MTLRALALLSSLAFSAPSFAGAKLDLTPWLGTIPLPGDFKVFSLSTGGQRTARVLDVQPWSKGWRIVSRIETSGAPPVLLESYVIPGRQLLEGSESYADGVSFRLLRPAKGLRLLTTLDEPQRLRMRADLLLDDVESGEALRAADWSFAGFEDVATPSGSYPQALRARVKSALQLDDGSTQLLYLRRSTVWYAEGIGVVRRMSSGRFYVDGSLREELGMQDEQLSAGRHLGVAFP